MVRHVHADMLGTTRRVTDASGAVAQSLAYTAFGEMLGAAPTNSPRYGYAGAWGYQDDRLGTPGWTGPTALHVGARYYEPSPGRFLGRDPIGILRGLNVYEYLWPTLYADPNGLSPSSEFNMTAAIQQVILSGITLPSAQAALRSAIHYQGAVRAWERARPHLEPLALRAWYLGDRVVDFLEKLRMGCGYN